MILRLNNMLFLLLKAGPATCCNKRHTHEIGAGKKERDSSAGHLGRWGTLVPKLIFTY